MLHIFFLGGFDNSFGGIIEAHINDFKTGIPQPLRDGFDAVIVTVETKFR